MVIDSTSSPSPFPRGQGITLKFQPFAPEGRQQKQEELQSCNLWNKNHIHRKIDKMKRQRTMFQMKEQDKTSEKQLNEVEIGNLPEKEFTITIVKMIQDLEKKWNWQLSPECDTSK